MDNPQQHVTKTNLALTSGVSPPDEFAVDHKDDSIDLSKSIHVACAAGHDRNFDNREFDWEGFTQRLMDHKVGEKEGECYLQGITVDGAKNRNAKSMLQNNIIALDLDKGDQASEIIAALEASGLECIMCSTHSHLKTTTKILRDALLKFTGKAADCDFTEEEARRFLEDQELNEDALGEVKIIDQAKISGPVVQVIVQHGPIEKYRLIFCLATPFVFLGKSSQIERIRAWSEHYAGFANSLGLKWDKACKDASRVLYFPRHPKGAVPFVRHFKGRAVRLETYPSATIDLKKNAQSKKSGASKAKTNSPDAVSQHRFEGQKDRFIVKGVDLFKWNKQFHFRPVAALKEAGYEGRWETSEGKASFCCPWESEHTEKHGTSKGFYAEDFDAPSNLNISGFKFGCMHSHGDDFDRLDFLKALLESDAPNALPIEFLVDPQFAVPKYPAEQAQAEIAALASSNKIEAKAIARRINDSAIDPAIKRGLVNDIASKTRMKNSELVKPEKKVITDTGDLSEQLEELNKQFAITLMNGTRPFIVDLLTSKGEFSCLSVEGWHNWLAHKQYLEVSSDGEEKLKPVSHEWMRWSGRRQYKGVEFEPSKPTDGYLNLFSGWNAFEPSPDGDWSLLKQHILDVICRDNIDHFNWFMTWLADIVQFPGRKMGSAVAIQGPKGCGKSIVFNILERIMNPYVLISAHGDHVTGNFNFHLAKTLLLVAEETVFSASKKEDSPLKNLITSEKMMMEKKGVDAISMNNYTRVAMLTNDRRFVNATAGDERRYFVLKAKGYRCADTAYFKALMEQMDGGGYTGFLQALKTWIPPYELGWDILRQPPKTKWLAEQVMESLKRDERFFITAVENGRFGIGERLELSEDKESEIVASLVLSEMQEAFASDKYGAEHANNRVLGDGMRKLLFATPFKRKNEGYYRVPPLREVRQRLTEMGYDLQPFS